MQRPQKISLKQRLLENAGCLIRTLPPEFAHHLAIRGLSYSWTNRFLKVDIPEEYHGFISDTPQAISNLKHPLGLAAGFDKDAKALMGLNKLGFSFIEVGTVTPRPQPGNPKPRVFRINETRELVNRMGFNNLGVQSLFARVQKFKWINSTIKIGINIGKNKTTPIELALDDYIYCYEIIKDICDYIVINISSPNTPDLRSLASVEFIENIAGQISPSDYQKIFIKIDPDMEKSSFQALIGGVAEVGFAGVILTNTTKVGFPTTGGLSGHSLLSSSNEKLEWAYEVHKGTLSMIASGGVLTGIDVFQKISRGASLVQIYSALIYRGPFVVPKLLQELWYFMGERGYKDLDSVYCSYYNNGKLK